MLVGSVSLGLVVGVLFVKFRKVGLFFIGSIGGFGFGLLLFNAAFYLTGSYVALWAVSGSFALINGLLVLYESEHLIIHSTTLFGVFFLVDGVAMFAGHFDNPFMILDLIRNEEIAHVDPLFYAYLGAGVVLYIVGLFY